MLKRNFRLVALLFLVVPASFFAAGQAAAQAQPLKVGYTDHEVIILNMPRYQEIQQQLQREYVQGQQELQTRMTSFQEKVEKFQKQQALLSAETRQKQEQELMQEQQQLQQSAAEKEQALAERERELMTPIYESVDSAIQTVAKDRGLDLVLRAQVGVQPLLLYVNEDRIVNITEDVARRLGIVVDETAEPTAATTPAGN